MRQQEIDAVKDETFRAARAIAGQRIASGQSPSTQVQLVEFPGLADQVLLETVGQSPDPLRPVFTLEWFVNYKGSGDTP